MGCAPGPTPRKRPRGQTGYPGHDNSSADRPPKHVKRAHVTRDAVVEHELLSQYYPETQTLRQYVLAKLPVSSRIRRRKIASAGLPKSGSEKLLTEDEIALGELLDSTVVACRHQTEADSDLRWEQWVAFSQKGDKSYDVTLSDGLEGYIYSQAEIVDFVVWLLFSRESAGSRPKHLLCDGFRRQTGPDTRPNPGTATTIPGLYSAYPNQHVQTLKASPWPQLLKLLAREGERIMIDLLVDWAIFRSVKAGKGNLYQLSGIPVSELEPLIQPGDKSNPLPALPGQRDRELRPSEIPFVRSRILYARAALNDRGLVHFGLRHIHVLNRFPRKGSSGTEKNQHDESVVHIMMYMFPRQFGLHNVFTSVVDRQKTAQKFQDYTLREKEIAETAAAAKAKQNPVRHVPKRLRGKLMDLVQRLQVLHGRCSYAEMLHHYCPVPGQLDGQQSAYTALIRTLQPPSRPPAKPAKNGKKTNSSAAPTPDLQYTSLTDLATPVAKISAFCQAVLSRVIPNDFWGRGPIQEHNKACFLKKVHHFIHLRRFESMCLHEVMQGMKISDIEWLTPPRLGNLKSSQSDTRKRTEIFYEFLYYLFDSFLIPLIRSNFYVTESSVDRCRLFFFRQDVWRYVAEPAMAVLKTNMFEEVKTEDALRILDSRRLGFSQVRLLPKQTKMRPIMNLRRRTMHQGGKKILGRSINSILAPVSSVLKLEKSRNPDRLGSSLFSVGDIYQRIKAFKTNLGPGHHQFYFAKVDVQAAFDTIPQDAMILLLKQIPQQRSYTLSKHAEVALVESPTGGSGAATKTTKRWHTLARSVDDSRTFPETVEESLAPRKKHTVFVNSALQEAYDTRSLLALAASHVKDNLVRIGKKFYRQKAGIPQGSVLSSTLCNYFYADLEREHLGFLGGGRDCLLLRLIDDFVLITTEREKARRFVEIMHAGLEEYGVAVNEAKSLVNFGLRVKGTLVPRLEGGTGFPYCGLEIDVKTLGVRKQREGVKGSGIFNALTVEYSRCPGRNFKRKIINAFKNQSHLMFFDTAHNSRHAVLCNIYSAFAETATKMWAYARCMVGRLSTVVLIDTIKTLIDVAFVLLTSKARSARYPGYVCCVKKEEVSWFAMVACRQVLVRKQSGYKQVISWLEEETRKLCGQKGLDVKELVKVAKARQ
ncbi:hypothetical protein VTI74DRAFT_2994 [Chaetomium olivicolor]